MINRGFISFIYNKLSEGLKLSPEERIYLQAYEPNYGIYTKQHLLNLLENILKTNNYITYFKPKKINNFTSSNIIGKKVFIKYKGRYMTLCTDIRLIVCTGISKEVQYNKTPLYYLLNKYSEDIKAVLYSIYPSDLIPTLEANNIDDLDELTEYTLDNGEKVFNEFILAVDNNTYLIAISENGYPKFYLYTNNNLKSITIEEVQLLL